MSRLQECYICHDTYQILSTHINYDNTMILCDDCSDRRRMKDVLNFLLMYILDLIQKHIELSSNTQEDQ